MRPIVARLSAISYNNPRGMPVSTLLIQYSGNGSRIWETTAGYTSSTEKLQLTQIRNLLEEVPKIIEDDPTNFNGKVVVHGLSGIAYDLLRGATYNYELSSLVNSCKELINRHSVTLGISSDEP